MYYLRCTVVGAWCSCSSADPLALVLVEFSCVVLRARRLCVSVLASRWQSSSAGITCQSSTAWSELEPLIAFAGVSRGEREFEVPGQVLRARLGPSRGSSCSALGCQGLGAVLPAGLWLPVDLAACPASSWPGSVRGLWVGLRVVLMPPRRSWGGWCGLGSWFSVVLPARVLLVLLCARQRALALDGGPRAGLGGSVLVARRWVSAIGVLRGGAPCSSSVASALALRSGSVLRARCSPWALALDGGCRWPSRASGLVLGLRAGPGALAVALAGWARSLGVGARGTWVSGGSKLPR